MLNLTLFYIKRSLPLLCLLVLGWSQVSWSHDIPTSVSVHMFVKPEGDRLNVLVRAPTEALSEIDFPTRGPGYLDFAETPPAVQAAVETYITPALTFYEEGEQLPAAEVRAARIDLPADDSFSGYEQALANVRGQPLGNDVDLIWSQGVLDVWLTYPIEEATSDFAMVSTLGRLGTETNTVLRYLLPDGEERAYSYWGNPGKVELNPGVFNALKMFTSLGFEHILGGWDHLLFLFCLIIPVRRLRSLVAIVTAFTIAHSITLIGAALGLAPSVGWFAPLIEALIALSIVYMACENIIRPTVKHRWLLTFGFGLIHGFGFSFLLSDSMQFAGGHLVSALLAFNVGVELGQLVVLILVVPVLQLLFKYLPSERVGVILLSALVLHEAWHWLTARLTNVSQYQFQWPQMDTLFWVSVMQWGMMVIIIGLTVWGLQWVVNRFSLVEDR